MLSSNAENECFSWQSDSYRFDVELLFFTIFWSYTRITDITYQGSCLLCTQHCPRRCNRRRWNCGIVCCQEACTPDIQDRWTSAKRKGKCEKKNLGFSVWISNTLQELPLPDGAITLVWHGRNICLADVHIYKLINLQLSNATPLFPIPQFPASPSSASSMLSSAPQMMPRPVLTFIKPDEFLVISGSVNNHILFLFIHFCTFSSLGFNAAINRLTTCYTNNRCIHQCIRWPCTWHTPMVQLSKIRLRRVPLHCSTATKPHDRNPQYIGPNIAADHYVRATLWSTRHVIQSWY